MTRDDVQGLLDRITYKKGTTFEIYRARQGHDDKPELIGVHIKMRVNNANSTDTPFTLNAGVRGFDPAEMNEALLLVQIDAALETMERHERRERFRLDGKPVVPPHVCERHRTSGGDEVRSGQVFSRQQRS